MQTQATINPKTLTFSDWQVIAAACENSSTWAFYRWVENYSDLESVPRTEIKEIAEAVGYSVGWITGKIDEHC
ncbi:MAG TPA: hypothetical protein V6D33_12045 [Cyanophyceae cyanobacterium]